MNLEHRELVGDWLNEHGLVGDGVEVGCAEGNFATSILSDWSGKRLFMVDPWEKQSQELYPQAHADVDFDAWYQSCVSLAQRDTRATLIRKTSLQASSDFDNWSLDFAYIDAAHDYGNVYQDLELWYSKLKPGGLFGGHDFNYPNPPCAFNGVMEAVTQWMREKGLRFTVTRCTSWWTIKV